ncbi:MAG TPA: hypothetical protein VM260_11750 [Pirellula sp.]|nr:hypothetical protein [Pirellula sp.]
MTVRFQGFEKRYFMDLLLAFGLMVEAKTVESLNLNHHDIEFTSLLNIAKQWLHEDKKMDSDLIILRASFCPHRSATVCWEDLAERSGQDD